MVRPSPARPIRSVGVPRLKLHKQARDVSPQQAFDLSALPCKGALSNHLKE
jgi:hypothetical protein